MKELIILTCVFSAVASASYLFCAYSVAKHMQGRWLRLFLTLMLLDSAVMLAFMFLRIINWYKTPLLATLIVSLIASVAGIGMFLAFSGWLKNGKHKEKEK